MECGDCANNCRRRDNHARIASESPCLIGDRVVTRDIPNAPGYRVTDDGCVWSCIRKGGTAETKGSIGSIWRQLTPVRHKGGYQKVKIYGKPRLIHTLVLEAFVGPRPEGASGCHNNGIPCDNRLDNLRWDTPRGNSLDRLKHGTMCHGEKSSRSKFTNDNVRSIRESYSNGARIATIAREWQVTHTAISNIVHRKRWTHVT